MCLAVFWVQSPKWVRALFYVAFGWIATPYLPAIETALGSTNLWLLLFGGIVYTVGALIYAFKYPNPSPRHFGYHEIFHIFVVVASAFHFSVIYRLTTLH
jgi:hemolysin III